MQFFSVVFIGLVVMLSACAPGVKSSSSVYAINLDSENPNITAGQDGISRVTTHLDT